MMVSAPTLEPALQPSTAVFVFAASIASPSVQSPEPPGLCKVEVTLIVAANAFDESALSCRGTLCEPVAVRFDHFANAAKTTREKASATSRREPRNRTAGSTDEFDFFMVFLL
jgi:hypothetical protein